jgi:hypothetical protein
MEVSTTCYSCGGSFPPAALSVCPTCHEKVCFDPNCDCSGECRCSVVARSITSQPNPNVDKRTFVPFTISYVKDLSGKYLAVNNPSEFLDIREGYTDIDVFGENLAMEAREYDQHVVQTGSTVEYLVEVITRRGKRLWQHVKFPITTGKEALVGGYCKDITEMITHNSGLLC